MSATQLSNLNKQYIKTNQMEKSKSNSVTVKLPNELCQQIFNCEFQIDVGNVTEELISKTVELYVEAVSFYANQISQYADNPEFDLLITQKKHAFYQEKIKKLLSRNQVEKCLVGVKTNKKTLDFQKQLVKVHENAPQQAKLLIEYFKNHHKNQEKLIKNSIDTQNQRLNDRIRRRSLSKSGKCEKNTNKQKSKQKLKEIYDRNNRKNQKINKLLQSKLCF